MSKMPNFSDMLETSKDIGEKEKHPAMIKMEDQTLFQTRSMHL